MKLLSLVAVAGLLVAGCSTSSAEGDGGTIIAPSTAPSADESASSDQASDAPADNADASVGTRSNPAPIGATAKIGDWEVRIIDVKLDAEDLVMEENMFNDPPAEGRSFVLWTVEGTYVGDESGNAWIDLSWKVVGSGGNSFGEGTDSCGVIPNSMFEQGETFPGGVITGNVCVAAETAQLSGGTILVEQLLGGARTFFALQ